MYPCVNGIHTEGRKRLPANKSRLAKPSPTPVAGRVASPSSSCALTIPAIGHDVLTQFEVRHDLEKTVRTLYAFLDLGMVSEKDLEEAWQSEREVLYRAFHRFIENEGSSLKLFKLMVMLSDSPYIDGYNPGKAGDTILFCFFSKSMESLFIGTNTSRIEEAFPGLGETLLYQIGKAVSSTLYCVTPEVCLDLAKFIYWQCEDDESETVAEMIAEGENPEDVEIYRRGDYLTHIPEWAANPSEKLATDKLEEIAQTGEGFVRDAARTALDLAEQHVEGYQCPYFEEFIGENIDPALYVRWSEEDDVGRVYDDYWQYAMQTECTEMHGYLSSKPDKEGISTVLENIRQFFRILRALDKAFLLIGERIQEDG